MKKSAKQPISKMDNTMRAVWFRLREDFSRVLGFEVCNTQADALRESISAFRKAPCGSFLNLPPYFAKCYIQLDKFLKRYRFANDLYTDDELLKQAERSFIEDNHRVAQHMSKKLSSYVVLQRARLIAKQILGEYDLESHISACRFGKNASVGSPFLKSYLDLKLLKGPLTGSTEHIRWFNTHVLPGDSLLSGILNERVSLDTPLVYSVCSCLPQTFVPKAFDKLRGITPNTLLGSFYTYGLGMLMRERLEVNAGLNLSTLQTQHGKLVKRASKDRKLVTGDLTSASQSITSWHVKKVLPYKWYKALNFGRIVDVSVDGVQSQSATFAGMGIGFTFPLQTLIFYCLLEAIKGLTQETGLVSVYGDDLIYPRCIHRYVVPIFTDLGFKFNVTKTFASEYFRESCGCDFYHGIDCRPVSPAGTDQSRCWTTYTADLYKLRNNLTRKWSEHEISRTLHYIDCQIAGSSGNIFLVPPHFPDVSGIRSDKPDTYGHYNICYNKPKYIVSRQAWEFKFMSNVPTWQPILSSTPYLWDVLRTGQSDDTKRVREPWETEATSSLKWTPVSKKPWRMLSKHDIVVSKLHVGKKYKLLVPNCQTKGVASYSPSYDHTLSWSYKDVSVAPLIQRTQKWVLPEVWIPFTWIKISCEQPVIWTTR